jgi:type III secretion protein V
MDGAMKFVKGDVIASLVITVVNILGGLAIGVGQRDLPVLAALKRYGLLTIGDGLVSQIPALILSTAAGVLVTRTASEEPDTPLGEELARHLFGIPKALRVAAVFVLGLAMVPGLPTFPFLVIAAIFFFAARVRTRQLTRDDRRQETEPAVQVQTKKGPHFVPMVVPWSVDVSADLASILDVSDSQGDAELSLRARVTGLRERIFAELGVPLPAPRLRINPELPARHALLALHEVPAHLLAIPKEFADGRAASFIADETAELVRSRAADFLGLAETQRLLDELEQFAPATVRNVVPKPVTLTLLSDVLRRLLEERIPIRDLRAILESLATAATLEKDPLNLAEYVRGQMRRSITFRLTRGAPQLGVILLDPTIEDTVRRAITRTASGAFLTIPPAAARDLIAAIRRSIGEAAHVKDIVLLTQPDVRRFVRKLIEPELPHATVVSFAELLPEIAVRPLARANLVGIG